MENATRDRVGRFTATPDAIAWDDELNALAVVVWSACGPEILRAASRRAMAQARTQPDAPGVFEAALRVELKRIVQK